MKTMPEVLQDLARLAPDHFRAVRDEGATYYACCPPGPVGEVATTWPLGILEASGEYHPGNYYDALWLEMTLRAVIQERGWVLEQMSYAGQHSADIRKAYNPARPDEDLRLSGHVPTVGYDSPAIALAHATCRALTLTTPPRFNPVTP